MDDRTDAISAAVKHRAAETHAAAMKHRTGATVETAAAHMEAASPAMEAAAASVETTTAASAAVPPETADLRGEFAGDGFRRGHSARVDQRHRLGALDRCGRQRQNRGGCEAQTTSEVAD
jgi:hypothetical protein